MSKTALFILTMMLAGCASQQAHQPITWDDTQRLPKMNQQPNIGVAGPLVGLIGGKLLIAGGANFPDKMPWDAGQKQYQQQAYIYTLENGKLQLKTAFHLQEYSAYGANVSAGDKLYSAGGENAAGPSNLVHEFTLDANAVLQQTKLPSLPIALTNAGLVHFEHKLYFIGGENGTQVSKNIYTLDLAASAPAWELFMELPYAVTHAVTAITDEGKLLIAGGRKSNPGGISDIYSRVLAIDISTKEIKDLAALPEPLAAATGLLTADGDLLLFGGDNGSTFHQVETLIAAIQAAPQEEEKAQLTSKKNKLQLLHPGFTANVWRLDMKQNSWTKDSPIKGLSPVTTTAVRIDNYIIIPTGEIKAGVRTDQILIGNLGQDLNQDLNLKP